MGNTKKLDASGRIRLPESFRSGLLKGIGRKVFVTSPDDRSILVFPLQVWIRLEERASKGPRNEEYLAGLRRLNCRGYEVLIGRRGLLTIPRALRTAMHSEQILKLLDKGDYFALLATND